MDTRKMLLELVEDSEGPIEKSQYGRTAFNGVLRHNDRVNMVQKLMKQYQQVNKQLIS